MFLFLQCIFGVLVWNVYCDNPEENSIVDLSWGIDENTVYWPGNRKFEFTKVKIGSIESNGYWFSAKEFCMAEHGGTHLDAPRHFDKDGWTVGQIPFSRFNGFGALIDVSEEVEAQGPNFTVQVRHLEEWKSKQTETPDQVVLLVRTGWHKKYNNETEYLGSDGNGNLHFPGISKEAAEWIVAQKNIVGVGIDTASLDQGISKTFLAHQAILKNKIYGIENLNFPENAFGEKFHVYVLPIKLMGGTGGPVRVFIINQKK
ncbi:uncharacterized protein LOC108734931 [Agrilus planipennis]|uniref:Uncharacterized protein LOC108734931 n=1 Tax=Agrilus planipennis TaxID=224129 RepID=A0A1W4WE42_AGRPL|nr:uncharacterized protein LOC108734931 [Agrilus planipennis]